MDLRKNQNLMNLEEKKKNKNEKDIENFKKQISSV